MQTKGSFHSALNYVSVVAVLILLAATCAWPSSYNVVYNFPPLASIPSSGLITDAAGNAYGTTAFGGSNNAGVIYQLSPATGAHLVYAFHGPDGRYPTGNLVFDSAGNLYGTTAYGGANATGCQNRGCGTVFKLTAPSGGGQWTETVLHSFCSVANCSDGANPFAGVIVDSAGNIYGTTETGGNPACQERGPGCGTVFELQPSQSGWKESVLYAFMGSKADGAFPLGSVAFDAAGNLYSTASAYGPGVGSAFRLAPSGGSWSFEVIYAFEEFSPTDGNTPNAGLIFDAAGNLYGTTSEGGQFGFGTVFELTPSSGSWTETILYNFAGGNDGELPEASLVFDSAGNLYGTTFGGGSVWCGAYGCGTVFKLTAEGGGQWTESLFRFPGNGSLGSGPSAPLLLDAAGDVYGVAPSGGRFSSGVVFKITQ